MTSNRSINLIVLAALLFCSHAAQAGIYIEPYLGYEFGKLKVKDTITLPTPGSTNNNEDFAGYDLGVKVGYSFLMLVIGVDYAGGSLTNKNDGTNTTNQTTDLGIFVGASLPFVKASVTYFTNSQMNSTSVTDKGSGVKIGAGYTGLPLIAINADYIIVDYNKISDGNNTHSSFDAKRNTVFLSVSVPLTF